MNKAGVKYSIHVCPDPDIMQAYLNGSLDSDVRALVDLHVKECPFCTDAVEGLELIGPSKISHLTDELNQKIDKRLKRDSGKFYWYTAAAILIVALISGFLIYQLTDLRKERNITDVSNERKKSSEVIIPSSDNSTINGQQPSEVEPVLEPQERKIESVSQEISNKDLPQVDLPEIAGNVDRLESVNSGSAEYNNDDSNLKREIVADSETSVDIKDEAKDKYIEPTTTTLSKSSPAPVQNASAGMVDTRVTSAAEESETMKIAEEKSDVSAFGYAKNNQENTAKKSANKVNVSSKQIEQLYFENKYEDVIRLSDRIDLFAKSDQDKVLWLRANSFHALNKTAEAITVLNILESYQNKYTTEASKLRVTLQQLNQEK